MAGAREGIEWFGVDTKYFVGVLAPQRPGNSLTALREAIQRRHRCRERIQLRRDVTLPSGNRITQEFNGYIGPKLEDELELPSARTSIASDRSRL